MNGIAKYGLIAAVLGGIYLYNSSPTEVVDPIDLNAVLDVTVDTIHSYQAGLEGKENLDPDQTFIGFSQELQKNYNAKQPPLHTAAISVVPRGDASLLAYEEKTGNTQMDDGDDALFLIEVDGENSRIIATSRSGAVNDHHISGTGLLAGYLIGSMLTRQRGAGVSSKSLASKQPRTAQQAARSRAGSGSHSRGK